MMSMIKPDYDDNDEDNDGDGMMIRRKIGS